MICLNCKRVISRGDKFCTYCGARVSFKEEKNSYPKVPEKYRIEYIGEPTNEQKGEKQKSYKFEDWESLKLWWHRCKGYLFIFIFLIGIVVLSTWYDASDESVNTFTDSNVKIDVEVKRFPALAEPKTVTFEWEYNGSDYLITETFYKTVYNYYNSSPEKYCLAEEENYEICYKGFLKEAEEDNTISRIASDIKAMALENGLNNDELVELTVTFVQSIPYDWDKYELIESLPVFYDDISEVESACPRYPYEVLYDNKGICSGKTFLATLLLREMNYGVALFDFDNEEHIAPAVKCPKEYSSYSSGYCFAEVTILGFRIGEIPRMDIDAGIPKIRIKEEFFIELFGEEKAAKLSLPELKNPKIYEITDGNSYQEIIKTVQTIQRIETLEKELDNLEKIIDLLENEVNQLESSAYYYDQQAKAAYRRHEILEDDSSYNEYSWLFSQYESAYNKYESKANEYDREVNRYNNLVEEYNILIEDFYK